MEDIISRFERRQKLHRIACYLFIGSIALLYTANFVIQAAVYHENVGILLKNFLLPLAVTAIVYAIDWKYGFSAELMLTHIPKVKMVVLCALLLALYFATMVYQSQQDNIDFYITILAMTSLYIVPYAFADIEKSCVAIVCEAVVFTIAAAKLGNNSAAIVSIYVIAATLICCLPKLTWFIYGEEYVNAKTYVALVMLFAALMVVFFVEETGVIDAFYISSKGRPGWGSSAFVNQQCREMIGNAKFVGSVSREYYLDTVFYHRVPTFVLASAGWLAVAPLVLALVLFITLGIFLCHKNIGIQYYIAVSFMAVITVQIIGYVLMCVGIDSLLFSEVCPFLDGDCIENTLCLLMGVCILPPKQKKLPDMHENNTSEEDDLEEWLSSWFDINVK